MSGTEMYEYCEAEGFEYAFGYAVNEVLKRRWPGRDLWIAASEAVRQFIDRLRTAGNEQQLFVRSPLGNDLLHFAPRTPK